MAGKSYIDCWPIYARHVVCVKFPFGTLPPRRMLLLVAQWQDPFSLQLQLQPRLHFIIFSRAHTRAHQRTQHSHSPASSPLISSHSTAHSLAVALRRCDWLRSRTRCFDWPRPARAACRGCGLSVCVCTALHAQRSRCFAHFPQDALAWKSKRAPFVCCIRCLPALDVCAQQRQTWQHQQQQQPNSCFGLF